MSTISNYLLSYLAHCENSRRLSSNTIRAYRIDLYQLCDYFCDCYIDEIEPQSLENYIAFLHEKYMPKTVKRKIATLKAFFHYHHKNELINNNPFLKIDVYYREPAILPKIIPLSSVEAILIAAYKEEISGSTTRKRENATRDIAFLELLFATGMRVSELCGLDSNSIDIPNQTVLIHGKGSKERIIQLTNKATIKSLNKYYNAFESSIHLCNSFFVNRNSTPLSDQSARRIIRHYSELASVKQHITPHMFRHTFATSLLDAGVDIRYIQELLGHSSIAVTQIYTHVSLAKQKEILSTKHPRNSFNI